MKKFLLFIALGSTLTFVAQEKITEGKVISNQTITSDNEQVNQQLAMMGEMVTTTYFKDGKSRSDLSNPMSGDVTTIIDSDSKQMLTLMKNPMMGNKYMVSSTKLEDEDAKNITVTKGDATKTILGYDCQQYFVTFKKEGQEMKMELFTTDKIPVPTQTTSSFGDKLSGFPLYFKMDMQQMGANMTIENTVTEIKKEEVADSQFDMTPPEGYENMGEK